MMVFLKVWCSSSEPFLFTRSVGTCARPLLLFRTRLTPEWTGKWQLKISLEGLLVKCMWYGRHLNEISTGLSLPKKFPKN